MDRSSECGVLDPLWAKGAIWLLTLRGFYWNLVPVSEAENCQITVPWWQVQRCYQEATGSPGQLGWCARVFAKSYTVEFHICGFGVCTRPRGGGAGHSVSGVSSVSKVSDQIRPTGRCFSRRSCVVRCWAFPSYWAFRENQLRQWCCTGLQIETSLPRRVVAGHGPRFRRTFPRAGAAVRRSAAV